MKEILIRESTGSDAMNVHALVGQLPPLTHHTPYTYWNLFSNFSDSCFVAINEGKTVGFVTSHPTTTPPQEWFIWQAGILPEYRRTGLRDALGARVIGAAMKSGAVALTTTIEADNTRSLGSFQRAAHRLGATIEEIDRFNLTPDDPSAVEEVLYRLPLPRK